MYLPAFVFEHYGNLVFYPKPLGERLLYTHSVWAVKVRAEIAMEPPSFTALM
jgi:hypothetical protein